MSVFNYEQLKRHIGHEIVCVAYGDIDDPECVAIECNDCYEVLVSYDKYDDDDDEEL